MRERVCGSRTCKPNSVRSMNAAGRSFLWATHYCGAQATYPEVVARRAGTPSAEAEIPPYLVLLRVGFALPAALLRRRCALTAPFHPYLSLAAPAVCFLWHFPSNGPAPTSAGALPDVIRHTALRSSDFPLVLRRATVRSGCQPIHYSAGPQRRHVAARWRSLLLLFLLLFRREHIRIRQHGHSDQQWNHPGKIHRLIVLNPTQ